MYCSYLDDMSDKKLDKSISYFENLYSQQQIKREALIEQKKNQHKPILKTLYKIKGIIVHEGNPNFGHYTCYVRLQNKWLYFDDHRVKEVDKAEVFRVALGDGVSGKNLYALIYVKNEIDTNQNPLQKIISQDLKEFVKSQEVAVRQEQGKESFDQVGQKFFFRRKEISQDKSHSQFSYLHPRISSYLIFLYDFSQGQKNSHLPLFNHHLLSSLIDQEGFYSSSGSKQNLSMLMGNSVSS